MEIQSSHAYIGYSQTTPSQSLNQTKADVVANMSAAKEASAGTTSFAQVIVGALKGQPSASTEGVAAVYDTCDGPRNVDIDAVLAGEVSEKKPGNLLSNLPPLLLPTKNNIEQLTHRITNDMPGFLADNDIPSAPSSVTYDTAGKIQLPSDYAYAAEFKQALEDNPAMARKLHTVNALTSHYVGMQESLAFQREYAGASSAADVEAVVARYSHLFSNNPHYETIALLFTESGELSLTHDDKPLT